MSEIRGVQDQQIVSNETIFRDTRPFPEKVKSFFKKPAVVTSSILGLSALSFINPSLSEISLLVGAGILKFGLNQPETAPLKMPKQSGIDDPNMLHPGTGKPMKANGIFYLGNEKKTAKEIWLNNDDCRQHFLILGTTGAGKATLPDTLVHTPDRGFIKAKEIKLGDYVTSIDGDGTEVIGVYPQDEKQIYKIKFSDGRSIEISGDHLWEVYNKHWRPKWRKDDPEFNKNRKAAPKVWDTKTIKEYIDKYPKQDIYIPLPKEVQKPEQELPIDPYTLGALIGDGCYSIKNRVNLVTDDVEIFDLIKSKYSKFNYKFKEKTTSNGVNYNSYLNFLSKDLESLGILGQKSNNKFIPEIYKNSSVEQRWKIIRGLFDTDGTCDNRKVAISYCTVSEQLAKDIQEIIWSLGGLANITINDKKFYRDKDGNKIKGQRAFIIHVRHPEPSKFFHVERKKSLASRDYQYSESLRLKIESIEDTGRQEKGICFRVRHPRHLFVIEDYLVTHNTETLLGFVANALSWGSGCLFCDGKGDVALYSKINALARRFGREDDVLVLNYMTGNQDVGTALGGHIMSNTLNPFSTGSSDSLTQMVVSLMDDAGGDGAMWKGRATAMFTGVMRALVFLRDQGEIDLNISEIRDHLNLKRIIDLVDPKVRDLPQPVRKTINSYLTSLPGYQEDKGYKQSQTTLDQHGYLEMQFTKILGSLADVYGYIFKTPYGEIDMYDVVLNRRILVIMLPALEKSGDEIANLGKIIVSTLKGMMGATLGNQLEGGWNEVVENRVTSSPSPFLTILDEVGYYTVEGMALMAAQARSLGFSMIYASQDIPAMKRLNDKEAASIIANTNTKIFMRTEESGETGKLAIESAAKAVRTQMSTFEGKTGWAGISYTDDRSARTEVSDKIDFLDLKDQSEGEMHILFKAKLVRAKGFYANPEGSIDKKNFQITPNHFIILPKPRLEDMEAARRLPEIMQRLIDPEFSKEIQKKAQDAVDNLSTALEARDEIAIVSNILIPAKERYSGKLQNIGAIGLYALHDEFGGKKSRKVNEMEDLISNKDSIFDDDEDDEDDDEDFMSHMFQKAKKESKMRKNVPHGVSVGDDDVINMADKISTTDSMSEILKVLNFDEDEETTEDLDEAINQSLSEEKILGDFDIDFGEDDDNEDDILNSVSDVDKSLASSKLSGFDNDLEVDFDDLEDDEDEESSSDSSSDDEDDEDSTKDFLQDLLSDDDD